MLKEERWRSSRREPSPAELAYAAAVGCEVPFRWAEDRVASGQQGAPVKQFARGLDDLPLKELVQPVHVRWVVRRFYRDAKGQLGLDDHEGRLWPGFQRHVALVMPAHRFRTLQQSYAPAVIEPRPEAFPVKGRKSLAALRRAVLEELLQQVIAAAIQARARPK